MRRNQLVQIGLGVLAGGVVGYLLGSRNQSTTVTLQPTRGVVPAGWVTPQPVIY